jgi:hypothetical protein
MKQSRFSEQQIAFILLQAEDGVAVARWCMDRALVTSPVSGRISADPGRDRHAARRHPVENAAPDFGFCPLIGQSPGVESPADDGLVAKHDGLDQAPSIVT